MSRRRATQSIAANPVLVGAVTVLVVVVAVFLAYNANQGLPFVPTQQLKIQMPQGANVLPGNEIREGGYRIGIIQDMVPVRLPDGTTGAELDVKIDKEAGDIPVDSRVVVRPRSLLGLKFVELDRGRSRRLIPDGGTLPASQAHIPVELDEYFNTFDAPTRRNLQESLTGYGNALAFRGASLNETIGQLPFFLSHLEPVMRTLADRERTNLPRFFKELGDAARIVAPIAEVYARQFRLAANVFEAWTRDPEALRETLRRGPPTLDAGIRSFRIQRPFLVDFLALQRSLRRATDQLEYGLSGIIPALRAGPPVLRRTPEINEDLRDALRAARDLFEDPATPIALRGLQHLGDTLNPTLRFLGPYITVCNYFNYAFTHLGEHVTEPDLTGFAQRTQLGIAPRQDNSPGTLGAAEPANGKNVISGPPVYLHAQAYPSAITPTGAADCESGQRGYIYRLARNSPEEYRIVTDPYTPGIQGPTFTGRDRVLPGQTFSRRPEIGPRYPEGAEDPMFREALR